MGGELEEKARSIEALVREFLKAIGENPWREGLKETPARVARMWVEELAAGYRDDPWRYVKVFRGDEGAGGLVIVRDVPVRSVCEHHLMPFFGYAHIAYIPEGAVLGFSKFARIVDVFARRLQIQERLTKEIADFLYEALKPRGVLVIIDAIHTCAFVRGVEEPMHLITEEAKGCFSRDPALRREALNLILSSNSLGSVAVKPDGRLFTNL